jgi:hypothetical protein
MPVMVLVELAGNFIKRKTPMKLGGRLHVWDGDNLLVNCSVTLILAIYIVTKQTIKVTKVSSNGLLSQDTSFSKAG